MNGYFIIYIAIAIWLFLDAKKRQYSGLSWAVSTVFFGPFVVPFYIAKRPLKDGEVREGGFGWNVLKYFALFWTITMFFIFIASMVSVAESASGITDKAEKAGFGIGMALGGVMIFFLWFSVTVGALVLGFLLKKSSVIERGPTGPLALKP